MAKSENIFKKAIDLGFAEECESWLLTNRYFPSKIGGKPAWLDLENLPKSEELNCSKCGNKKVFLCQIYAPIESKEDCFHRTIFVFICRTEDCYQANSSLNISVFRSQLRRENLYYPFDPPDEEIQLEAIPPLVSVCSVCGCRGPLNCSRCKKTAYCSAEHQRLDWKYHKTLCNENMNPTQNSVTQNILVFPEYEIEIEPESFSEKQRNSGTEKKCNNETELEYNSLKEYEKLVNDGKDGVLKDASDSELSQYASNSEVEDKQFNYFKKTIKAFPEQVIRYDRGGLPLWITDMKSDWQNDIRNCENCGKEREFEFQIMPQMLNYLKDDKLDWGVLAIFTCSDSCNHKGYINEIVIKQDIVKND